MMITTENVDANENLTGSMKQNTGFMQQALEYKGFLLSSNEKRSVFLLNFGLHSSFFI